MPSNLNFMPRWGNDEKKRVAVLVAFGATIADIAKEMDRRPEAVRKQVRLLNLYAVDPRYATEPVHDPIPEEPVEQLPDPIAPEVAVPETKAEIQPETYETAVVDYGGVPFLDVREHQCRYPLWGHEHVTFEDKRFCGEYAYHSYCDAHAEVCGVPNTRWPSYIPNRPHPRK